MTKRDLTGSNEDLIAHAGSIVLGLPRTALGVTVEDPLVVRTRGIDQLDVRVDGRFQPSRDVSGRVTRVELPAGWGTAEIIGSAGGRVRQRRVLRAG
jgi:hypothetical protein